MSRLIRRDKATYEQNIALNANKKQFYRYVRNSSTTHVPVPVLKSISLLSLVSKIMEHIIAKQLTPFLLRNNIIPPNQHGFTPGRSTSTNLLPCINDRTLSLENHDPVDVIYLCRLRQSLRQVPT